MEMKETIQNFRQLNLDLFHCFSYSKECAKAERRQTQSCNGGPIPEVDLPEVMVCSIWDKNASLPLEVWLQLNPIVSALFPP